MIINLHDWLRGSIGGSGPIQPTESAMHFTGSHGIMVRAGSTGTSLNETFLDYARTLFLSNVFRVSN